MTAPVKPPTSVRGHVSEHDFGTMLDELVADMPSDLLWPTSVLAYASMRREAHVAAILAGWGLQIRRAQWQLDGTGCRPEIVRMVADDLGLMVKGDDRPQAARVRGVSWHEHLRSALLDLTYGHMGFELEAEVTDGSARLVGLWERPPWTVGEIHTDPKSGAFLGVTQDSPAGRDVPQIRADRMCWYAREREGANWAGVSLLRPVWPLTLVKREMLKVHAIANRRWSAGVSTVRALPGTNPTPAQHAAAGEWAQQARAGDQAGGSLPPGFIHEIVGMSGSVPDTVAFIRYLDEAASRACLAQYLNLGSTETGSRALGTAFIDNLMLALETEALFVADVATRQVAARIVEWNAGPDEPVPQVTVSGIGSRREITAESLQLLLSSGALSAEPGLEDWVRREYRLPARADMPKPAPATPPAASAARKRAPRRPRKESAGQLALPVLAQARNREPTEAEEAAGTDFDGIAADLDQAQQDLAERWPGLSEAMIAALVAAVVAAVAAGTLDDLGDLAVPDGALTDIVSAVGDAMVALAATSAGRAADELSGQGVDVEAGTADEDRLRDAADAFTGVIAGGYASGAGRVALTHAGPDADADEVGEAVRAHLDSLSTPADTPGGLVATNLGGALAQAVNAGRTATFAGAPDGTRYMISAALDRNTCDPCEDDDQRVFDILAEAQEICPAGGNRACLGGLRCRCQIVALAAEGE